MKKEIALIGLDDWEIQYWKTNKYKLLFNKYKNGHSNYCIGLCEGSSYQHPFLNKMELYEKQGIKCGTGKSKCKSFWVKPKHSLYGMATDTYKSDKPVNVPKDFMWVEHLEGEHRSTDFVINKGKIIWSQVTYGYKDEDGYPNLWEVTQETWNVANKFVEENFIYHNGTINIESIGDKIIEVHCRPATQFFDIFNIKDMAAFVITNHFNWNISNWPRKKVKAPCCSWVYYTEEDMIIDEISILDKKGVKSIQKTYKSDRACSFSKQRGGKYRICVVNTEGIDKKPRIKVEGRKLYLKEKYASKSMYDN